MRRTLDPRQGLHDLDNRRPQDHITRPTAAEGRLKNDTSLTWYTPRGQGSPHKSVQITPGFSSGLSRRRRGGYATSSNTSPAPRAAPRPSGVLPTVLTDDCVQTCRRPLHVCQCCGGASLTVRPGRCHRPATFRLATSPQRQQGLPLAAFLPQFHRRVRRMLIVIGPPIRPATPPGG